MHLGNLRRRGGANICKSVKHKMGGLGMTLRFFFCWERNNMTM